MILDRCDECMHRLVCAIKTANMGDVEICLLGVPIGDITGKPDVIAKIPVDGCPMFKQSPDYAFLDELKELTTR